MEQDVRVLELEVAARDDAVEVAMVVVAAAGKRVHPGCMVLSASFVVNSIVVNSICIVL